MSILSWLKLEKPSWVKNDPVVSAPQQLVTSQIERGILGINVITSNSILNPTNALSKLSKEPFGTAFFFHNATHHQFAANFAKHTGKRYQVRNNAKRRELKPMLYPDQILPFDRTHVFPIGFHGSENDRRLVVGWNSELNRGPMNKFEQKIKKYNHTHSIIWYVSIEKQIDNSAIWKCLIYDGVTHSLFEKKIWHDKAKFIWE